MEKYRNIIGRINYGLFLAVLFLLPFPQTALRYACTAWIITWVMELRWIKKPSFFASSFQIPFLAFGLWYVYKLLSGLWASDTAAWAWEMERYLTFILLVPVGIWGVNTHYDWRQAGRILVIGCLVALPFYLALMTALYLQPEWVNWFSPSEWDFTHPTWLTYFNGNISAVKHRLFLCSTELLGAYMAFLLYRKRPWILIPSLLAMLALILLTDSRQAVLIGIVLAAILVLYELPKQVRSRYSWTVIALGIIAGGLVLKFHPRLQQVNIQTISQMSEITYDHETRLNIWGVALQRPSDYLPWGLGAGQSGQYMIDRYNEVGLDSYANMRFHLHSQYLEELMEIGFIGLILFLAALLSVPLCARGQGRLTAIVLTTLFGLNMLIDCMFGLFCGIALWATFMVIIYLQSSPSSEA